MPPERLREMCAWDDGLMPLVGVRVYAAADGSGGREVRRSDVEAVESKSRKIAAYRKRQAAAKRDGTGETGRLAHAARRTYALQ